MIDAPPKPLSGQPRQWLVEGPDLGILEGGLAFSIILERRGREFVIVHCVNLVDRSAGEVWAEQRAASYQSGESSMRIKSQASYRKYLTWVADERTECGGNIDFAV
jgi:hypothetical protein